GAVGEIAGVGGELEPAGPPARVRADARERSPQRVLDGGRLVRRLGDGLQQLHAGGRGLLRRRVRQPTSGWLAHNGAVTDARAARKGAAFPTPWAIRRPAPPM